MVGQEPHCVVRVLIIPIEKKRKCWSRSDDVGVVCEWSRRWRRCESKSRRMRLLFYSFPSGGYSTAAHVSVSLSLSTDAIENFLGVSFKEGWFLICVYTQVLIQSIDRNGKGKRSSKHQILGGVFLIFFFFLLLTDGVILLFSPRDSSSFLEILFARPDFLCFLFYFSICSWFPFFSLKKNR